MKKLLSLILALMMLLSCVSVFAEDASSGEPAQVDYAALAKEVQLIPADAATGQAELGYVEGTVILDIDGLKFKDLNKNGALDAYEDYRLDTATRTADLIAQMTVAEKAGMMVHLNVNNDLAGTEAGSLKYEIEQYHLNNYLDNSNGLPDELTVRHNIMQQMSEATRLGIPMTISSDRQYNAWGGYIDSPHYAFGTSNDPELSAAIWEQHAKETRMTGYHLLRGPYGVELGVFNGEDPAYVAKMTTAEVNAVQTNMYTCVKHFIASGGATGISFTYKRSVAQNYENQMVSWKAAVEADTRWIMTNGYNQGLSNTVNVDYDQETMSYLRDTLGYDGVVLTDWGAMGSEDRNIWDNMGGSDGITKDGKDLNVLTVPERYAWVVNNGVDQLGGIGADYVHYLVEAIETGLISTERADLACARILEIKFDMGLFENAYCDPAVALAEAASPEYVAAPWEIVDNATLAAARNPEIVELERQLQAKSAVLVKNDNAMLPLAADAKVFFTGNDANTAAMYAAEAAKYATVVDKMEDADVVVIDITRMDDAAELAIDDANEFGKKLVITANGVDVTTYMLENADAVIYMNFARGADHGSAMAGFLTTTEAPVYAELLYGVRKPEGMIVNEVARNEEDQADQWLDLAGDIGASPEVRLILLALMRENPEISIPNNYGDALLCYEYGMRYGEEPEFVYDTLLLPTEVVDGVLMKWGMAFSVKSSGQAKAKVGEPYTVNFLLWNNGGDGMTTIKAYEGDKVLAEKIEAVNGGDWRVVSMDLYFDEAGEHQISIGTLNAVITVE